ncbi:PfkB family carbohydrate kinase [Carboxydochorda subterranea]|uniref:Tagatose-6-phosphate kinase n=1 Tax=Carboxydichorda subterranea TaxID=3109565 RepID=A0ABZ1BV98_9FIRM|nr:PfkB family carbohydrate kinase [Limnochorda sp. L945t]WRP16545.1 PfkB family carbohydrate kinase [Limnochorda sp. L945t]
MMRDVLLFGLNACLDRRLVVEALTPGEVHRASEVRLSPGGKGPNTAMAARQLGLTATVFTALAGHTGRLIAEQLRAYGVPFEALWAEGESRVTTIVLEVGPAPSEGDARRPAPRDTVLNEEGELGIDGSQLGAFVELAREALHDHRALLLAGSLPRGVDVQVYERLIRYAREQGRPVFVDVPGAVLRALLPHRPALAKPNRREFQEAAGLCVAGMPALVDAARRLLASGFGPDHLVISLGSEGAVLVNGTGAWLAPNPPVEPVDSASAGDAMMAALVDGHLRGEPPPAILAWGVACGAAKVERPGGGFALNPARARELLAAHVSVRPVPEPPPAAALAPSTAR